MVSARSATAGTSTPRSMRSRSGPDTRPRYCAIRSGVQWQRPLSWPSHPQGHGRVAFLPLVHVRLKCPKPKDYSDNPQTIGEHLRKRRIELGVSQTQAAECLAVSAATVLKWEKGDSRRGSHLGAVSPSSVITFTESVSS